MRGFSEDRQRHNGVCAITHDDISIKRDEILNVVDRVGVKGITLFVAIVVVESVVGVWQRIAPWMHKVVKLLVGVAVVAGHEACNVRYIGEKEK